MYSHLFLFSVFSFLITTTVFVRPSSTTVSSSGLHTCKVLHVVLSPRTAPVSRCFCCQEIVNSGSWHARACAVTAVSRPHWPLVATSRAADALAKGRQSGRFPTCAGDHCALSPRQSSADWAGDAPNPWGELRSALTGQLGYRVSSLLNEWVCEVSERACKISVRPHVGTNKQK